MINEQENLIKKYGIAITGNIGCGKSTASSILRSLGFKVYDADNFTRHLLTSSSIKESIKKCFGNIVFDNNNNINKKKLAELVFTDSNNKHKLENILHPAIKQELKNEIRKNPPSGFFFYEAALVFEAQTQDDFFAVWLVTCSKDSQIKHLKKRPNFNKVEIELRIRNQMPSEQKIALADIVIYNNSDVSDLKSQISKYVGLLKSKYANT